MEKRIVASMAGFCALLIAAACSSPRLLAQDEPGFYVGGNFGFARIDASDSEDELRNDLLADGFGSASVTVDETSNAFKILGGYQINRNLAVEAYYANLGTYDLTASTTGPVVTGDGEVEVTGLGIDVLGIIPLNRSLSGFGRIGLFAWESEARVSATGPGGTASASGDDDGTELKLGVGLEWALARSLRLRGELEYYTFEEKLTMFSVGLVFRF